MAGFFFKVTWSNGDDVFDGPLIFETLQKFLGGAVHRGEIGGDPVGV